MTSISRETHKVFQTVIEQQADEQELLKTLIHEFYRDEIMFWDAMKSILLNLVLHLKNKQAQKAAIFYMQAVGEIALIYRSSTDADGQAAARKFILNLFNLLLQGMNTKEATTRANSVQLTGRFLSQRLDYCEIPEDNLEKLNQIVKERLRDKNANVRKCTCELVLIAQKPLIEKEDYTEWFLLLMTCDASETIRRSLTQRIPLTRETVEGVEHNLRDKTDSVRQAAYARLCEIKFDDLQVGLRQKFLSYGFSDRNKNVNSTVRTYIRKHFAEQPSDTQSQVPLDLISKLDLENLPHILQPGIMEAVKYIAQTILGYEDLITIAEGIRRRLVFQTPAKALQPSRADLLTLSLIFEHLRDHDHAEAAIPNAEVLRSIVLRYATNEDLFKLHLAIKMSMCCELAEEENRHLLVKTFRKVCRQFPNEHPDFSSSADMIEYYHKIDDQFSYFKTTPEQIADKLVKCINNLLGCHRYSEYTRVMTEIINKIRDPMTSADRWDEGDQMSQSGPTLLEKKNYMKEEVNKLEDEADILNQDKQQYIESDDIDQAYEISEQLEVVMNTIKMYREQISQITVEIKHIVLRSLLVTHAFFKYTKNREVEAEHKELMNSLVIPALQFDAQTVQAMALSCIAQICLLDIDVCQQYLYIFHETLRMRGITINDYVCMKACFDIMMVYNILQDEYNRKWLFQSDDEGEDDEQPILASNIVNLMSHYLDCKDLNLKALTITGFCKLLTLGRIPEPSGILAKLLLQFWNLDSTPEISQMLHAFFRYYTTLKSQHWEIFVDAYKKVLAVYIGYLTDAEAHNDGNVQISETNFTKMFKMGMYLTSPNYLETHSKFTRDRNYNIDIYNYIMYSWGENLARELPSETATEAYIRIIAYAEFTEATPSQVWIAKKTLKKCLGRIDNPKVKKISLSVFEKIAELKTTLGATKDIAYIESLKNKWSMDRVETQTFIEKLINQEGQEFYTPLKRKDPVLPVGTPLTDDIRNQFNVMVKTEDDIEEIPDVEYATPVADNSDVKINPKISPDLAEIEDSIERKMKRELFPN